MLRSLLMSALDMAGAGAFAAPERRAPEVEDVCQRTAARRRDGGSSSCAAADASGDSAAAAADNDDGGEAGAAARPRRGAPARARRSRSRPPLSSIPGEQQRTKEAGMEWEETRQRSESAWRLTWKVSTREIAAA